MSSTTDKALIVFVKAPIAEEVKSRLSPPLTQEQASQLQEAILLDGIDQYLSVHDTHVMLCMANQNDEQYFRERFPNVPMLVQEGASTGDRISNAFYDAFSQGYRRVMLFSTDLPTLPRRSIYSGYQLLDAFDDAVVIGPTEDGGYYTIGMRMPMPDIFQGINWGRSDVYEQTIKRLCKLDISLYVLPPWYDIDTIADVRRLDNDLYNPEFNGGILTRTKAYIQHLRDNNIIPPSRRKAK